MVLHHWPNSLRSNVLLLVLLWYVTDSGDFMNASFGIVTGSTRKGSNCVQCVTAKYWRSEFATQHKHSFKVTAVQQCSELQIFWAGTVALAPLWLCCCCRRQMQFYWIKTSNSMRALHTLGAHCSPNMQREAFAHVLVCYIILSIEDCFRAGSKPFGNTISGWLNISNLIMT